VISRYQRNSPIDHEMHQYQVEWPAKEGAIKIAHITATSDAEGNTTVFGMGHDQKMYVWEPSENGWVQHIDPIITDEGLVPEKLA
jgi:hypothetical protein